MRVIYIHGIDATQVLHIQLVMALVPKIVPKSLRGFAGAGMDWCLRGTLGLLTTQTSKHVLSAKAYCLSQSRVSTINMSKKGEGLACLHRGVMDKHCNNDQTSELLGYETYTYFFLMMTLLKKNFLSFS